MNLKKNIIMKDQELYFRYDTVNIKALLKTQASFG